MIFQQQLKTVDSPPVPEGFLPFARRFAALVDGCVEILPSGSARHWRQKAWVRSMASGSELVILEDSPRARRPRWIEFGPAMAFIDHAAAPVLLVRQPRWPIGRILIVLLGRQEDASIVEWGLRLTRKTGAALTLTALTPPVPGMYPGLARLNQDWGTLMETNTALGRSMRLARQRCRDEQARAQFRVRQGSLGWLPVSGPLGGDCDLIGIASAAQGRLRQWLEGDPLKSLLLCSQQPILITKPTAG